MESCMTWFISGRVIMFLIIMDNYPDKMVL